MYMPEEPQEPLKEPPQQLQGTPGIVETPREGETPRGQTTSTVSETESVSEWEIERQKVKYLSRVTRKPTFCICKIKDADQLRDYREADQRLCFHYIDSAIPLIPKSEISSL